MEKDERLYETPLTRLLLDKASDYRLPVSGTFELTPMCNFDCRMCYIRQTPEQVRNHSRKMRTLEQWKKFADQAIQKGMLYLLLTGGEPLSWPGFWELYRYLAKKGLVLSINTNGSLIDDKAVARFREMPPTRINITLYGASDETYKKLCRTDNGFQKVDAAIEKLREAGITVKLNCSLTPYNVCDFKKIAEYAEKRKLILQINTYMFPPLRKNPASVGINDRFTPEEAAYWHMQSYRLQHSEESYQTFLKSVAEGLTDPMGLDESCYDPVDGKIRCRAGNASFWATWDGYLLPCGMMPEPRIDFEEMDFSTAWGQLTEVTEKLTLSGICNKCESRGICHSCAAMAMAETGDTRKVPRYLCEMIEEMKKNAIQQLEIFSTDSVQKI